MKTLYHGTASPYLPAILREGLKPIPAHRWDAVLDGNSSYSLFTGKRENPFQSERGDTLVYLSPGQHYALDFARMRAEYLRANRGEHIDGEGILVGMTKAISAPVIRDAKPALISVSLPEGWPLERDRHSFGIVSPRPIPPQFLQVVQS